MCNTLCRCFECKNYEGSSSLKNLVGYAASAVSINSIPSKYNSQQINVREIGLMTKSLSQSYSSSANTAVNTSLDTVKNTQVVSVTLDDYELFNHDSVQLPLPKPKRQKVTPSILEYANEVHLALQQEGDNNTVDIPDTTLVKQPTL